jgi:hypothetical protein
MVFVDNMHQFVTGLEALRHERQHHAILFLLGGEERAGVTWASSHRSSDAHRFRPLFHERLSFDDKCSKQLAAAMERKRLGKFT